MKITGIRWQGYNLPFRRQYITSSGQSTVRSGLVLFLTTDEGVAGVGEASPVGPSSPAEVKSLAATLDHLAPAWLERDFDPDERLSAEISPPIRFGLETALLDILGQKQRCPIASLLGGRPSALPVNALISAESPPEAVAEAKSATKSGFRSLKLKLGWGSPEQDEALVSAVRSAAGPEVKLRVDPNQAWSVGQAIETLTRLQKYDLEYVEQPVAAADLYGLAEVRSRVRVPVAADESLKSLDDLQRLLKLHAADIFILKAARLGGLKAALEIARIAVQAGCQVVVTSSLESGIGVAANAHLASALPGPSPDHGLSTGLLFEGDLVLPSFLPFRGVLNIPSTPGLGFRVRPALLEKYATEVRGEIKA
jgi:o-succinylbenzoate synthase